MAAKFAVLHALPMTNKARTPDTDKLDRAVANVAEHIVLTTLMVVPDNSTPEEFMQLVLEKVRAKADEKIKEANRRRGL